MADANNNRLMVIDDFMIALLWRCSVDKRCHMDMFYPAQRAARAFSDKLVPGSSCVSAPCLSHYRAQLRIVRCAHAMP